VCESRDYLILNGLVSPKSPRKVKRGELDSITMTNLADTPVSRRLTSVKHIIVVCSGKGGVGKSSVSTQLALSLRGASSEGAAPRVGILDIDLTGPSIPRMLRLDGHGVHQSSDGWVPVYADAACGDGARLACMSVGFLLKGKGDSVVWRGPKKNAMIRQFLSDVRWGQLDYLIIDTPPGAWARHFVSTLAEANVFFYVNGLLTLSRDVG
jgi:Mrp family chromosome partitioning ATPase